MLSKFFGKKSSEVKNPFDSVESTEPKKGTPFAFSPVGETEFYVTPGEVYGLDCPQGKVETCCGNKPCDFGEYRVTDCSEKQTLVENESMGCNKEMCSAVAEPLISMGSVPRHPVEVALKVIDAYTSMLAAGEKPAEGSTLEELVDNAIEILNKDLVDYLVEIEVDIENA